MFPRSIYIVCALVLFATVPVAFVNAELGSDVAQEIRTLLPKDAIPSINKPKFVSVKAADGFMSPGEMVIGVNLGGQRKAYSVPMLSSHEIVNDIVGGRKIAVTW